MPSRVYYPAACPDKGAAGQQHRQHRGTDAHDLGLRPRRNAPQPSRPHRPGRPSARRFGVISAQILRHVKGTAHRVPYFSHVLAVGESAFDGPAAQVSQHEVFGHAVRVGLAELRIHPLPELREPHLARLQRARDGFSQVAARARPMILGQPRENSAWLGTYPRRRSFCR